MKLRHLLVILCLLCPIHGIAQGQKLPELNKTSSPLSLPDNAKFKQALAGLLDVPAKQTKKTAVLENNDIEAHSLAPGIKSNTHSTNNKPNDPQTLSDDPNAVSDEYLRKEGIYLPNTRSTPGRAIKTKRK